MISFTRPLRESHCHILSLAAVLITASSSIAAEPLRKPEALIERYCYDCHGEGLRKGDMAIDKLLEGEPAPAHRHQWERAWKIVRHELMPPAGEDQPTEAERQAITRWIEEAQFGVDRENPDPGRVTIRRLNRMEYEFSVNDIFPGNSLNVRDMLPPDDTAFGFDNIGDFQTLSPALLEKYFEIAEHIVDRLVTTDGPQIPVFSIERSMRTERDRETKRTDHVVEFEVEHAGRYQLETQFSLGGWREFGGAFDFTLTASGRKLEQELIEVGGEKTHRYVHEIELNAGTNFVELTTTAVKPDAEGNLVHLELRPRIELTGPLDGSVRVYPEAHLRIFHQGEPTENEDERRQYAREILQGIAERAFRRPLEEARLDLLTDIATRHEVFEKGVAQALTAILASPRFLFRAETQPLPDDPEEVHPLDEYALASRLSYLLWVSIPDEELTQLAAQGKLRENLEPQVRRMLADRKADRFFEDFPGQWLRTRNVLMTPISRIDGEVNGVRGSMKRETEMLFEHIARNDHDLLELVTANYTFVDDRLANYYGIKDHPGGGFQRMELDPASHRGGILTHGSFLVSTSNPSRTSPVKRGLFVLENLLAIEPPPPPPDTPALEEPTGRRGPTKTVREQLMVHREDKACASCHAHFDPIGLVLENYDMIGRWRETELGEPILPNETTVSGQQLAGIDDLRNYFAGRKDLFYRCATEKLLTYALGRGLDPMDAPVVDKIAADLMAEGGKFSTLLMGVIESPQFQFRRGDDGMERSSPRNAIPEPPPLDQRKGRRTMRDLLELRAADENRGRENTPEAPEPAAETQPPASQ